MEENVAASEAAFFEEKEEALELLERISVGGGGAGEVETADLDAIRLDVARFVKIIEKYQEQSTLLDPHLERMMAPLTGRAGAIIRGFHGRHLAQREDGGEAFPFQCAREPQLHCIFQIVYQLCRCRGQKCVAKFFSHEVSDLEPTLFMLQSQDRHDHGSWETRYGLLLWLSMLVMVPFDIYTIDSSVGGGDLVPASSSPPPGSSASLVSSIVTICRDFLRDSGPTRDAAAICLASLLTRPDMETVTLKEFLGLAEEILSQPGAMQEAGTQIFEVTGVLMTLAAVFKKGHRDRLLAVAEQVFPHVSSLAIQHTNSALLRKLVVKLFQRMGMAFLPPRVVSWAYQRGQRSLLQNLEGAGESATQASEGLVAATSDAGSDGGAANSGAVAGGGAEELGAREDDLDVDVPPELEEVIEQLLIGLRDKDTVVRWSAAKGVGRITSRLPKEFADDVVASVLELFSDSEGDGAWHGGCLALAELARRGLLLPFRLPEAVPVVAKAIQYDVRRGSNSVGAHVRDAACYVCWAFARAYSPAVMRPHVDKLCEGMLLAALFDREINCRRAAAAAFQENVGRQGHENFPHGIEILTAADYFTLGVRANAYLKISAFVGSFAKYRHALMAHLYEVKIFHWDIAIRTLSSHALSELCHLDPEHVVQVAIPSLLPYTSSADILKRHGSILAVAELVAALKPLGKSLPEDLQTSIVAVVPAIEKARLYRGRGGEIIRQAACRLIECIASAELPLPVKMQLRLLDSLDESLKHSIEAVQLQAVAALRQFTRSYFPVGPDGPSARLQARVLDKYLEILRTADIASHTRGHALAVGALPSRLVAFSPENLDKVLATLCSSAAVGSRVGDEPDAETRRNALTALTELVGTVGIGGAHGMSSGQVRIVYAAYLDATKDYSVDKRGDVGSWSRLAAMQGLTDLITAACLVDDEDLRAGLGPLVGQSICAMLKQLSEKLDNVRAAAGEHLERLIGTGGDGSAPPPSAGLVPRCDELRAILLAGAPDGRQQADVLWNWALAYETFPKMVKVMDLGEYHYHVVAGLVLSVGGLTEAVVKSSSGALLAWAKHASKGGDGGARLEGLLATFSRLFDEHRDADRVILPLLKTLELLLVNGIYDGWAASEPPPAPMVEVVSWVQRESRRSTNVPKLFSTVNVLVSLLGHRDPLRRQALQSMLVFLGHRFPRVRKHAAEQLYSKVLVDGDVLFNDGGDAASAAAEGGEEKRRQDVEDLLCTVVWDAELQYVRAQRAALAKLLKVDIDALAAESAKTDTAARSRKKEQQDELASYGHLVREAGY